MEKQVKFYINGQLTEMMIQTHWTLLHLIRDELGLTGTKEGCGEGECGSCTVLVDDKPFNSCLFMAVDIDGKRVTTIEGISEGKKLHPLQEAFVEKGAIQCGFCTPGMVISAKALLDITPHPSTNAIRIALSGNLCRCTGYAKIIEAIQQVSK